MKVTLEQLAAVESTIHALRMEATKGDETSVARIRDIGLLAAQILERMALDETTPEFPEGGAVRAVAKQSSDWPHRLAAISEIRHGPSTGNADKFAEFLQLGLNLGIVLSRPGTRGNTRDFQGKSGFILKVIRRIKSDLKLYSDFSEEMLKSTDYHAWDYQIGVEKSPELHAAFVDYIMSARTLPASGAKEWAAVAMKWAHVETEGDIEKESHWPRQVSRDATRAAGTVAAQLNKWFKKGIPQVMRETVDLKG